MCPSRQVGRGAWLDMPARHDRPGQVNSGGCTPRYAPYTRRKYKPAWTCQPQSYVGQFWLGHEELDYDSDCVIIAWRKYIITLSSGGVSSLCVDFQAMPVHLTCSPQTVYKFLISLFVHNFEFTSLCLCLCSYSFEKDSVFCLKVCCAWTHGGSICGAETGWYIFFIYNCLLKLKSLKSFLCLTIFILNLDRLGCCKHIQIRYL